MRFFPRSRLSAAGIRGTAVLVVAILAAWGLLVPAAVAPARATAAGQAGKLKTVSYHGYRFAVPASWPVLSLARHPHTCVRFDLHAVYVGRPSADQGCPSWLLGATEAIVIEPGAARAVRRSAENPVSDQITATAPRLAVSATFSTDPGVIDQILASAGLPRPVVTAPDPAAAAGGQASGALSPGVSGQSARAVTTPGQATAKASSVVGPPALPATVANDRGLGFDACAAPSASYLTAWWAHSPYRAVGIYIGGSDRACAQPNLTPGWVRAQAGLGWRFIPLYAGPQAAFGQLSAPARQGTLAANDAVTQAERLGFGPRTPLYYDMEAYLPGQSAAALTFLSAWTTRLHQLGYQSGVYSSSDSAIADLARQYKSRGLVMPDVMYDALWNGARNTADGNYRAGEWTGGRRLHQFSGNVVQTFGGDTLEIDQDYLDITLAAPGGTGQASPAFTASSGAVSTFFAGPGHHLWEESQSSSGRWSRVSLGAYLTAAPSVVRVNSAIVDVFYRGRGDVLWERTHTSSGWQKSQALTQMGKVGAPHAVAQPNGVIDVFWHGTLDDHLWHAQLSPGRGWSGPQRLEGDLASDPYPVETPAGQVQVFWKGTNGDLWRVVRGVGRAWTAPQDLGMGKLGGPPHAVALGNGEVDVFWEGSTGPHAIWSAVLRPGHRAAGPSRRGGVIVGQPWPLVAGGTEQIAFRGPRGRLYSISRSASGRWGAAAVVPGAAGVTSAPFATASSGSAVEVFWIGRHHRLWTARYSQPGGWHRPVSLGGGV